VNIILTEEKIMLKNVVFKILFASIIICVFVKYVSSDISISGDATQGIDIKMVNYVNNPPGVDEDTEFSYDLSASFSVHYKGEKVEAKAGFAVGDFKDLWAKLAITDDMSVLVGKALAPFKLDRNGAVCGGDVGNPGVGRFEMIQFQAGGFKIAAMNAKHKLENLTIKTTATTLPTLSSKNIFPRIEAIFDHTFDNKFTLAAGGGFQTYRFEYGTDSKSSVNVNSFILGLEAQGMFGPVTVTGRGTYGSNLGLYLDGGIGGFNARKPVFELEDEKMLDNISVSAFGGIKIKATDAITPGAGYGFTTQIHDIDDHSDPDNAQYMFANCEFVILDHLIIHPEVGYLYELDDFDGNAENSTIIIHSNVKIKF
jgi:hypothetical protein